MTECVICGHQVRDHQRNGCSQRAGVRRACDCRYAELPPLPPEADVDAHRERADWWEVQARAAWTLAFGFRYDFDRCYPLMRFHKAARQADIDERRWTKARELSAAADVAMPPVSTGVITIPVRAQHAGTCLVQPQRSAARA